MKDHGHRTSVALAPNMLQQKKNKQVRHSQIWTKLNIFAGNSFAEKPFFDTGNGVNVGHIQVFPCSTYSQGEPRCLTDRNVKRTRPPTHPPLNQQQLHLLCTCRSVRPVESRVKRLCSLHKWPDAMLSYFRVCITVIVPSENLDSLCCVPPFKRPAEIKSYK